MRKSNSPPVLICQFTWKFANMVLTGYDMIYQGDKADCELILHSLNNP